MLGATSFSQISSPQLEAGPQTIHLKIEDHTPEVEVALDQPICLGRNLDTVNGPAIDLTEMGGVEKGVSRYHARILIKETGPVVVDLCSLNGTFVNARRIAPYMPEVIKDGDYLHLGSLLIQVKIP
jgi:pSer/pThr/pTyr-binding forkhead associated (FHA) protein